MQDLLSLGPYLSVDPGTDLLIHRGLRPDHRQNQQYRSGNVPFNRPLQ